MQQQQQRRGFVIALLSLAAALAASAFARAAHATDIYICNKGALEFDIATATRRGDGFFTPYSWYLEGWFEVAPGDCANFPDHTDQPIYVAIAFTDEFDHFGTTDLDAADDEEESDWQDTYTKLCLARGAFHYTWESADIVGPCDSGFAHFPAILYLEPYASTYTLDITLGFDSVVYDPGDPIVGSRAPQEPQPYSGGRSWGDDLKDAFVRELAKAFEESEARSAREAGGGPVPRDPPTFEDAPDDPFANAAAPPPELGPPKPFEPGTLTAKLFGSEIVRRVDGDGQWFGANGVPVYDFYQLRGSEKADLLDAPVQNPPQAELEAALQTLETRVVGRSASRAAEVTKDGRLYYAYLSDVGMRHDGVNLVTLLLDFATIEDNEGYSTLHISCRTSDRCVLAWGEDADGKPGVGEAFEAFRIFTATHDDAEAVLAALKDLKALYPAEPAVIRR